ncbi:hypothetical protein C8R46DRAFT_1109949 [Mycena filopes]|nr:hypothetical protein C8R46DRAFT_1109949 [Mycena filopes]
MSYNRRKSMRLAADPCLGFYIVPTSNPPPHPRAVEVPPIAVLGSDSSADEAMNPLTKTYNKKSRTNLPDEDSTSAPHVEVHTHHQSKPLKKRILRAAVLTNADPDEWLLQEDSSTPRNPLTFVEERAPSRQVVQAKRRTWSLVDPRKALPARSNSFSSRAKGSARDAKRNTLSGWQARIYLQGSVITKRKTVKTSQPPSKCLPLSFVPLQEAEKRYSLMRRPNRCSPPAYLS